MIFNIHYECISSAEVTLEDDHIWDLAKSITSKQQLRDLALNILKIPAKRVDSALYNEREIQDAALEVLKTWQQGQNNRQEAYRNLYTALYSNGWKLLAGELKQWVEGTTARSPFSEPPRHPPENTLDKDPLDRDPSPWTETPPLGQRPLRQRNPLDREIPWARPPPCQRQRPPSGHVALWCMLGQRHPLLNRMKDRCKTLPCRMT